MRFLAIGLLGMALAGTVQAAGSASTESRKKKKSVVRPTEPEVDRFQAAIDLIQAADALAQAGNNDGATAKYRAATRHLEAVVAAKPGDAEAWNQLGYSRRSAGEYPKALEAYQKALELNPGYPPAIEYRAEAHLALDRLDEVRQAYQTLFNDPDQRQHAATLMHAIKWYVQVKKDAPPAGYEEFAAWAQKRRELAAQADAGGGDW